MKKQKENKGKIGYDSLPHNELEKWMKRIVPKIIEIYGLGNLSIYFQTHEVDHPRSGKEGEIAFDIQYNKAYKSAYINIFPLASKLFAEEQLVTLSSAVTHEIAHIITSPFADIAMNRYISKRELTESCEELTESVAQIGRQLVDRVCPDLFKVEKRPEETFQKIIKKAS
jgi:hypothetical protein